MDAELFDLLARKVGLQAVRRTIVAMLVSGTLGSVLSREHEAGASSTNPLQREDDQRGAASRRGVAAEKRKKRKKRKNKKKKRKNTNPQPGPRDEAPPCTATSCPLPPRCSATVLETCVTTLHQQLVLDIEVCRPDCAGGESPACRTCLEPIVAARQPDVQACIAESCGGGVGSSRSAALQLVTAESESRWFVRLCDKPCCNRDLAACIQDFSRETGICLVGALFGCFAPPPACVIAALAAITCVTRAAYENTKCEERYGCDNAQFGCRSDDTCCPAGQVGCGDRCCLPGQTCTTGSYQGVPRSGCCIYNSSELGPCDGVCCDTKRELSMCCPGLSNPCRAIVAGC